MSFATAVIMRTATLAGWTAVGQAPRQNKCVVVCAHHTSNWDGALMLAGAQHFGLEFAWVGKHTLFRGPLGPVMRGLGGVSVDRRGPGGQVQQLADEFARRDSLYLALAPEGTRGRAEYWKSGFYRIAEAAGVPIELAFLDYSRKQYGFGPTIIPRGNLKADMDIIRAFYADKTALVPSKVGPVRLKEEEAA